MARVVIIWHSAKDRESRHQPDNEEATVEKKQNKKHDQKDNAAHEQQRSGTDIVKQCTNGGRAPHTRNRSGTGGETRLGPDNEEAIVDEVAHQLVFPVPDVLEAAATISTDGHTWSMHWCVRTDRPPPTSSADRQVGLISRHGGSKIGGREREREREREKKEREGGWWWLYKARTLTPTFACNRPASQRKHALR